MAVNVTFYTFSKKINSTAQPARGTNVACNLKGSTTIISPSIEVQIQNPTMYNYCYIADFNRYYYIGDWAYFRGVWTCNCNIDVLATYRAQIGTSNMYVLRAAADYDGNIIDSFYPMRTSPTFARTPIITDETWYGGFNYGTYVIGIINSDNSGVGGISYYTMAAKQFKEFMGALLTSNPEYLNADDSGYSTSLVKTYLNPFQYVASVLWYPFNFSGGGGAFSELPMGWWTLQGVSGGRVNGNGIFLDQFSITLPKHPLTQNRNYLNSPYFTKRILHCFAWDNIDVANEYTMNASTLYGYIRVDCLNGMGRLSLSVTEGEANAFAVYDTMIGVAINISQLEGQKGRGIANGIGGIARSLLTFDVEGIFEGIESFADDWTGRPQSMGSNGSAIAYGITPYLMTSFSDPVEDALEEFGRPLCQNAVLNTLPGYQKILSPDIELAATDSEINSVNEYLSAGYFYE